MGGDEFVVLLSELADDSESAQHNATQRARLIHRILDQEYKLKQMTVQGCSGSIGLAIAAPGMTDRELLLREADQAMYQAKKSVKINNSPGSDQNADQSPLA